MANAVFQFAGGSVTDTSTVDSLRESAAEWLALALLHEAEAEVAAERGDFDTALEQLTFATDKIANARRRYENAREAVKCP